MLSLGAGLCGVYTLSVCGVLKSCIMGEGRRNGKRELSFLNYVISAWEAALCADLAELSSSLNIHFASLYFFFCCPLTSCRLSCCLQSVGVPNSEAVESED